MNTEVFLVLLVSISSAISAFGIRKFFSGVEILSLNANRTEKAWFAKGVNASTGTDVRASATVPGGIYSDLEANGLLPSPIYHQYNDFETRWVGRTNWNFSRTFTVTKTLLEKAKVVLVCEGLDTVSAIYINGKLVGQSENMFVRYIYDIKSALTVGKNSIVIAFQSPVEYAQSQYREHEKVYGYVVKPAGLVPAFRGEDQVHFIRKMQSSFAWDWGPSYPSSGIWKDIYIEGFNGAIIRDVMIFTTPSKSVPDDTSATQWNVTARIYYDCAIAKKAVLRFKRSGSTEVTRNVRLVAGTGLILDISLTESGANTKLWWPNGYGKQNLYNYNVFLGLEDLTESSSRQFRVGFRTVELLEDFVDSKNVDKGREFYFRVNGIKMYSKGSNSIPIHVLPERITQQQTEWLLRAAKMSYQNMIRVWGGGMYESDTFYDWADEYGILIWEDFMFACALYPATDKFLENVRREVETQVKRLQHRTSLAMWAGNNENEGGLRGNWFGYNENYGPDYIKLYIDTIKALVNKLDPSRHYLSSSPTNGKKTEEEGWVASYPADLKYGDIHAYNYYADTWDWRIYTRGRYSSEYGYQSFPHFETLAEVADNISTWTWNSPMLEHRQHHPNGQTELRNMIRSHLPFPVDHDTPEALPYLLYMTQLAQVMGQKTQTEFYRRLQDKLYEDGTGHNMGALYWQLNDIWQGCSWSSVEINGRWKLQMYYAKKFFAPVLASLFKESNGDLAIELISDSQKQFNGTLKVQIFKLNNNNTSPVYEKDVAVQALFLTSQEVFRIKHSTLKSLNCNGDVDIGTLNPCVVYTTLPGTPDNFLFLQYPQNKLSLRNPKLRITSVSEAGDGRTVRFSLNNEAIAPFVFLTVSGDHKGYFSDNGFLQVSQKNMTYYSENGITTDKFLESIQVMSLYNVTAVAEDFPVHSSEYYGERMYGDEYYSDSGSSGDIDQPHISHTPEKYANNKYLKLTNPFMYGRR